MQNNQWQIIWDELPTKSRIDINNSFHSWCMLIGSVWIWIESNLFRFIEGHAYSSTSWYADMNLTLNEAI